MKKKIYSLLIVFCLCSLWAWAQNETESNDNFSQANYFAQADSAMGSLNCTAGDAADYFKSLMPNEGVIRIYLERTNASGSNGQNCYFHVYDNAQNQIYYAWSGYINAGVTKYDTIDLYCRAVDSIYFMIDGATACFNYKIHYEILNSNPLVIDTGINDDFTTASNFSVSDTIKGTIQYSKGGYTDGTDYFKTLMPNDGTVRIYLERTNTSNSNGQNNYFSVYDKTQTQIYNAWSGYINAGVTQYDTINLYCRSVDSMYFKLGSATSCFSYKIHYEVLNNNAQPVIDTGSNDDFTTASNFSVSDTIKGTIQYSKGGYTDNADYFKTLMPYDGTVRIYLERTNTSNNNSQYNYFSVYDKSITQIYNAFSGYMNPGVTKYDTIDLYCRAADSLYIRLAAASTCFSYKIHYEILNSFPLVIDAENNDNIATAINFSVSDTIKGTIKYSKAGYTDDNDYFKTLMPNDGTVRIYLERTNTSPNNGQYSYFSVLDKAQSQIYYNYFGYINAGETRYDTIDLYCRAADSMYFGVNNTSVCFKYKIHYEVLNNNGQLAIDTGFNDNFASAINFNSADTIKGTIKYSKAGYTDDADYFKTLIPNDGTIRIYLERTNTSSNNSQYNYFGVFDKAQTSVYYGYLGYINAGETRYDTIDLYCRAADSMYFRMDNTSVCFKYKIHYEVLNDFTQVIDQDSNDDFANAVYFNASDTVKGRLDYVNSGGADNNDYFKTFTGIDGILKIYIERKNTSNANSQYCYLTLYDRNQSQFYNEYNGYINAGVTKYDTSYIYCRGADTTYFRMNNVSTCFQYKFHYEVLPTNNGVTRIDTGDNESITTANYFNEKDSILGNIQHSKGGFTDNIDYYKTYVPHNGTLRIYFDRTNTTNANSQTCYLALLDKNQNQFYNAYNGYINAGVTQHDTLTFYCGTADTLYFSINTASVCFSYKLRYEVTLGSDTTVYVCPGFTTDISNLYNTAPFNSITYTNMGGGAMPPLNAVPNGLYRLTVEYTPQSCSKDTAFITVGLYPKPNIGNDTTVNTCPGFTTDITSVKNTAGLTTQWFGTSTPTTVGPGVYTLIVTNIQGCMDTAIITVGLFPKPNIGNDTTVNTCPGFTKDITAVKNTTSLTTQWLGTSTPTTVNPGSYTLIVTNINGCKDTAIITVGLYPKPNLGNDTSINVCPGFTTDITGLKNTTGLTVQWMGTSTPTTVGAGSYTLIVTNTNGCMDTAIINVGLYPKPNLGNDTSINVCPGFTTDITGLKNTTGLTVQWMGTSTPTTVVAGSYTLIVTNTNGCMDTAIITVGLFPKPNIGNDTTVNTCPGFTKDITAVKNTTGLTTQWIGTATPNAVNPGSYTLIVTNLQGCMDTAIINVGLYPKPNIGNDTSINVCPGFTTDITGLKNTTGLTVQWMGTSTPTTVGAGSYTLIVTNTNGCMDTAIINVGLYLKPNLGDDTTVYAWIGESINFVNIKDTTGFAAMGWTPQWTSNINGNSGNTTVTMAGDIVTATLTTTSSNGCIDTMNITINPVKTIVPAVGGTGYNANVEVTDALTGWTNYYYNNSTPGNKSDDILLLSLKKNGNTIGTIGDGTFTVNNTASSNAGNNTGVQITNPLMSNPSSYYVMHRYWKVTATSQPSSFVGVRFYYNNQDFNDANGSFGNTKTLQQMVFYHLKDGNPDPSTNWAGATLPVVSIVNGIAANDTTWIYSLFGANTHRAEFTVNSFSGGGGGFTGNNSPLPINEVSFTATAHNKDAVLNWMTNTEENLTHYEIEQSTDGNKFEQIGKQQAKGGNDNAYQFTAKGVGEQYNTVYYRIKLMMANNNHSYTPIARVLFAPTGYEVTIVPNPAKTNITIMGADENDGLVIMDMHGKIVVSKTVIGKNNTINLNDVASGTYIVQIIHQKTVYSFKLLKE